jgi:prepilin-type processing-associated H-X9-DG protein
MARAAARRSNCMANLKQIGLAIQGFHEVRRVLPRYRLCPAPWQGGTDLYCMQLVDPTQNTGPNETWWAPYDSRVPPTGTPLPDFDPSRCMLAPYIENSMGVFQCPEGRDLDPTSDTYGETFQVSYAMSKVIGGPNGMKLDAVATGNGTTKVMLAWDHNFTPGCSDNGGVPVMPFTASTAQPHYPVARHQDTFNVLFCDGHVHSLAQEDLQVDWFYAQPN